MADQIERVILEVDETPSVEATNKANAGLDSFEQKAEKATTAASKGFESFGRTVITVSDKSKNSIDRMVASVEKRAAAAGRSPLERLAAEREQTVSRVGGDPAAVARVTAAYERLAVAQRAADNSALLDKAQAAAKRSAVAAEQFETALRKVNAAADAGRLAAYNQKLKEQAALLESVRAKAEAQAAAFRKFAVDLNATSVRLTGLGVILTTAVTLPLGAAALGALKLSDQFKRAQTSFTEMLGSAQLADAFLARLERFALSTPFEFSQLIPAAQRMKAYGFAAKEIIPILRAVGDATAALGGNSETLDRIALALGQIRQKGRAQAEEMRQLAESGIPAWEILSQRIGKSIPEAMDLAKKGAISASVALPAILGGMVQRFGGQMARQNALLSGQFSNLKDQLGFVLRDIGDILTPMATTLVKFAQSAVGTIRDVVGVFRALPEPIQTASILLLTFAGTVGPVTIAIGGLTRAMALFFGLSAGGGLIGSVNLLRSLPIIIRDLSLALTGGSLALSLFETRLLLVGKAIAFIAAAFVGWNLGRWIRDVTGLGDAFDKLWEKMGIAARLLPEEIRNEKELAIVNEQMYQALRRRGTVIKQDGRSQEDWNNILRQTADQMSVFDEMLKKQTVTTKDNTAAKEAEKRAHDELLNARKKEVGPLAAIILQYNEMRREIGLTAQARRDLAEAVQIRLKDAAVDEQKKFAKERVGEIEKQRKESDTRLITQASAFEAETLRIHQEADLARLNSSEKVAERSRASQLRELEGLQAETLGQKLYIEERKLAIEEEFILRSSTLAGERLLREQDLELTALEVRHNAKLISEEEFQKRRGAIIAAYGQKGRELDADFQDRLITAQENAANRSAQLVFDNNKRIFDSIKRSAEGIFDQLFTKSQNIFEAIANVFKTAMLTVLKEIVTSQIARMFTQLFTGASIGTGATAGAGAAGGGGGILGRLGGLGGLLGIGGGGGGLGGTPPFVPAGTARAPQGGVLGGAGSFGGFAAQGAAAKGLLTTLGNIGIKDPTSALSAAEGGARGIGGAKGGGLLLGGGLLAFDGLRRGGLVGLAQTTAGGAMIGAKFGGPIGALIGGAIGAAAGIARLFIKGAEEKAISKVKQLYGITIDRGFAKTLIAMAKQQYGGDLDLAIRTREAKDMLELYAMSRGQSPAGLGNMRPQAVSLVQNSGGLFQAPTFQNGTPLPSLGGTLPTPVSAGAGGGTTIITLQLDGQATTSVMHGEALQVINSESGAVANSVNKASRLSVGRREAATRLVPGFSAG